MKSVAGAISPRTDDRSNDAAGPSASSHTLREVPSTSPKPRPARKQITQERLRALMEAAKPQNSSGGIYNIWHENFSGGDRNEKKSMERAETRCDIARDAGYTKADTLTRKPASGTATSESEGAYCCLYFARGCCPNGSDCTYLHRLPRPTEFNDQGRDIFGRSKFGDYRDDMGGVGSMQRFNKTLYVGRIHEEPGVSQGGGAHMSTSLQWRDGGKTLRGGKSAHEARRRDGQRGPRPPYVESETEKVVRRHFSEWGEIERVKVLHGRSCAFVTYKHEGSAQFAKEAMFQQTLDHNEILNVRWSTDDPNPGAQKRNVRELKQQGEKAIIDTVRPETIAAQEALRQLEGVQDEEDGSRSHIKRRRTKEQEQEEAAYEEEMRRLDEENMRGWAEIEAEENAAAAAAAAASASADDSAVSRASAGGLLSAEMMNNLQALNALRQQQQQSQATASKPSLTGLGSLVAYDSDSEEEEE